MNTDRHYQVVRYYPHAGHGTITEVLEDSLTLDEANAFARLHPPVSSEEEIAIVDKDAIGLDSEVSVTRMTDRKM